MLQLFLVVCACGLWLKLFDGKLIGDQHARQAAAGCAFTALRSVDCFGTQRLSDPWLLSIHSSCCIYIFNILTPIAFFMVLTYLLALVVTALMHQT